MHTADPSKKISKEPKKVSLPDILLYLMFAGYLFMVFGVTLLGRYNNQSDFFRLMPFYSYIEAWYRFEDASWRNLILNIFMMVPFGLLLPYLHKIFLKFGLTTCAGLTFSLLIEVCQLVLRRGIFETDDLINNTLGTLIGYGFYRLADFIHKRIKKEPVSGKPILLYQLPLIITAVAFISIFTVHYFQEPGNLKCHHIMRAHPVSVSCNTAFDAGEETAPVYVVPNGEIYKEFPIITEEEAYLRIADGIFLYEPAHEPKHIVVNDIFLSYEVDSKGFYQPIYILECSIDDLDKRLYTPAIR